LFEHRRHANQYWAGNATPYKANDQVWRRLPDNSRANKTQYRWHGPYRVEAVLPDGRYRLRDLENDMMCNEFVQQNLKPFLSVDTELTDEDYVIDYLISHKDVKGRRSYLVKWRNYPRSKASWEPRENLMINAETLVLDYERLHPRPATTSGPSTVKAPVSVEKSSASNASNTPSTHFDWERVDGTPQLPYRAYCRNGTWTYAMKRVTSRGESTRWVQSSAFDPGSLKSAHFQQLRDAFAAENTDAVSVVDTDDFFYMDGELHGVSVVES